MRRQGVRALMAAGTAAGKDMVQFPHQIFQFLGREIGGRQPRFLIGIDIVRETRMAGARRERDVRLTVTDKENAHLKNQSWRLSPFDVQKGSWGKQRF